MSDEATSQFNYSSLVAGFSLVLGGFALSYVDLHSICHCKSVTAPVFFVALVAVLILSYIRVIWLPFIVVTGNETAANAVSVIYYLCDMITSFGLDSLYIIRLVACTQMYKYHKLIYVLFIFPTVYVLGDAVSLALHFHPEAFPFTEAKMVSSISCVLVVGNTISHIATIVILLRDLGKFKDPLEKRNLKIVAAVAIVVQVGLVISGFFSLYDDFVYSAVVWYFLWTGDFIIFSLVNKHIKTFLQSTNTSVPDSRHGGSHPEAKTSSIVSPMNDLAHEMPATAMEITIGTL